MNLKSLSNQEILEYLPHKLQVRFAYEYCLKIEKKIKDPRSLKALEVIDKWLRDEATEEEIKKAKDEAYGAAILNTSYAAYAVAHAANSSINATYTINAAYAAANAVHHISAAYAGAHSAARDKLIDYVENLSNIEKVLYFGDLK